MGAKVDVVEVIGCCVGSGMAGILGSVWQLVRQTIRAYEKERRIDFMAKITDISRFCVYF